MEGSRISLAILGQSIGNCAEMLKQSPWRIELSKNTERLLVLMLLAVFFLQGAITLVHMSATGDETHYLGMGRYLIKNQKWDLADTLLQPPLSYYLHSIPLLVLPIDDQVFRIPDINERGRALMRSQSDDRALVLARIPILLLATGLGWLVFCWGKQAYETPGGLLALGLYALNPVIIANAVQITPDLCLTFFSTLAIYLLWRYRNFPTGAQSLWVGIALGLALLSKYSAVLVVLAIAILILIAAVFRRSSLTTLPRGWRLRHWAVVLAAALLIVNVGYLFHGSFLSIRGVVFQSGLFRAAERSAVLRNIPLPIPQAYLLGLDLQHSVVENGFNSFLLGKNAQRGWLHFYLVAFVLKTPIPFLLLLFLAAAIGRDRWHWIILIPVIIFPFYFSAARLSRGVRYILPVYPLLCVWISQLAVHYKNRLSSRVMRWGMGLLLVWYALGSLLVAPHYIAYFNEIGGGPNNGIHLLYESDFDWGQELKGLKTYLDDHKIDRIKFAYFSTADPAHYGIQFEPLPCESPAKPETGLMAASATVLQAWGCYDWLKHYRPVDKVGYTIFIYNIPSTK
jgi:4-amino-4-deoxy-L-arabinose transferase-like glycosyltransferase